MKILRNKFKTIALIILGIVIGSSITVYATGYFSKDIMYKKGEQEITVEDALNELFNKKNENSAMGVISVSSDANGGWANPYKRDGVNNVGYGSSSVGWYTQNNQKNAWSKYTYSNKVCVYHARIAYGVSNDTTWMQEGDLTIQASNDDFKNEVVDLITVHLSFDQELLKENKYGVFWEGDIDNNNEYYAYRVIAKDENGFTGVNKLQLSFIRYFIK